MLRAIHHTPLASIPKVKTRIKYYHDMSLLFTRNDHYMLIGCMDYPKCQKPLPSFSSVIKWHVATINVRR